MRGALLSEQIGPPLRLPTHNSMARVVRAARGCDHAAVTGRHPAGTAKVSLDAPMWGTWRSGRLARSVSSEVFEGRRRDLGGVLVPDWT